MNTENNQQNISLESHDNAIDLKTLFCTIWKGKWLIIATTFIFAVGAVAIALWLPNEYRATAVVQSSDSGSGGKLASLAGQFGGLASLAGIDLGSAETSDSVIAMEVLKSWGFAEDFIQKHNLSVSLFASEGWERSNNQLIINDNLYSAEEEKWIRDAPKGKKVEPSSWELYEEYKKRVSINQDNETGLISISVTHYSPYVAKQWTDWLVEDVNLHMKERALKEANESIKYLEEQIDQTSIAEIRTVFSELIQEQHKTRMLAQVSEEYTFKTVSPAKVPEEKSKPARFLIVLIGIFFGFFVGAAYLLIRLFFKRMSQD